ncbi:uncharacterized protein LY79DRAFT_558190 [Colletotrichum navitas]|uniref:Uncharacterized protein n=1 Tax=Colletotrichum navitas TaxID=681940 RepID=A0AAD8V3D3_9PEZI|nr:uncharacterized protein LY79DRAFT_558190 [Colletotrichum navitas]KAK1585712.1 hypothetical protein LY79DRAFT_558190 [Colletotrichum navitas]
MYFTSLLLLLQSLLLVAAAPVNNPSGAKRIRTSDFFVATTHTSPLALNITHGNKGNEIPIVKLEYLSTFTKKPFLYIQASIDKDDAKALEKQSLPSLLKAVTADEVKRQV